MRLEVAKEREESRRQEANGRMMVVVGTAVNYHSFVVHACMRCRALLKQLKQSIKAKPWRAESNWALGCN